MRGLAICSRLSQALYSWWTRSSFSWLNPILFDASWQCRHGKLGLESSPPHVCAHQFNEFRKTSRLVHIDSLTWPKSLTAFILKNSHPDFVVGLSTPKRWRRWFWWLHLVLIMVGTEACALLYPLTLRWFLQDLLSIGHKQEEAFLAFGLLTRSTLWLIGPIVVSVLGKNYYFWQIGKKGLVLRTRIALTIYNHLLYQCSMEKADSTNSGRLIDLLTVDVGRIEGLLGLAHNLWTSPIAVAMTMFSLVNLLDLYTAAIWVTILLVFGIGSQVLFSKHIRRLRKMTNTWTDKRVNKLREWLVSYQMSRLAGLDKYFASKIEELRNGELVWLGRLQLGRSASLSISIIIPLLTGLAAICYLLHQKIQSEAGPYALDAELVLPLLACFAALRVRVIMIPQTIAAYMDAVTSYQRIRQFVLSRCRVGEQTISEPPPNKAMEPTQSGLLVGVIGEWKSIQARDIPNLLHCIVSYLPPSNRLPVGSLTFLSENAWIINGTIRDNILLGLSLDKDLYNQVIYASHLFGKGEHLTTPQVSEMDKKHVGPNGNMLSGGQRQRLVLARFLYHALHPCNGSSKDLGSISGYILEDPLSFVDYSTTLATFNLAFKQLLLGKMVIVLGASGFPLDQFNVVLRVDSTGKIIEKIEPKVLPTLSFLPEYIHESVGDMPSEQTVKINNVNVSPTLSRSIDRKGYLGAHPILIICTVFGLLQILLTSMARSGMDVNLAQWIKTRSMHLFWKYLSLCLCLAALTVISRLYFAWTGVWVGCRKLYKTILWKGLYVKKSSLAIFETASAEIPSPTDDSKMVGAVLSRMTKDIDVVDDAIVETSRSIMAMTVTSLIMLYTMLWAVKFSRLFLVPLASMLILLYIIFVRYRCAIKVLGKEEGKARISLNERYSESIALSRAATSPFFCKLTNSLDACWRRESTTMKIRIQNFYHSYHIQQYLLNSHVDLLQEQIRLLYYLAGLQRWLNLRTDLLGAIILVGLVSVSCCFLRINEAADMASFIIPMAGLVIGYGHSLASTISWFMRQMTELEIQLISVDRVLELIPAQGFSDAKLENGLTIVSDNPKGTESPVFMQTNCPFVRYRMAQHGGSVLENAKLDINVAEWVGLTGPSGSGKSTLVKLLNGDSDLLVDSGAQIQLNLPVGQTMADWLHIVPQDPIILAGTLRENLDPYQRMTDSSLESFLAKFRQAYQENCGLEWKLMEDLTTITLSLQDRQLVSILRTIVKLRILAAVDHVHGDPSSSVWIDPEEKVDLRCLLVLDEATSGLGEANESELLNWLCAELSLLNSSGLLVSILVISHRPGILSRCSRICKIVNKAII